MVSKLDFPHEKKTFLLLNVKLKHLLYTHHTLQIPFSPNSQSWYLQESVMILIMIMIMLIIMIIVIIVLITIIFHLRI